MRSFSIAVICFVIGLTQGLVLHAFAQSPTPPGHGHGFLIDKHVAASVTCAQCHTQNTTIPPTMTTCLSCHGGTYAKLAAMTVKDMPNPHASHRGDVACEQCHHVHKVSETLCNQCHTYDMKTP